MKNLMTSMLVLFAVAGSGCAGMYKKHGCGCSSEQKESCDCGKETKKTCGCGEKSEKKEEAKP